MRKHVIIINGMGGSGKDTFVNMCQTVSRCMNISSVDPAKQAFCKLVGETEPDRINKTEDVRKLLSDMKRVSILYNDYPRRYIREKFEEFIIGDSEFLFIHIREPQEIDSCIVDITNSINGAELDIDVRAILVTRKSIHRIMTNNSDANVDAFKGYTHIIYNDSTLNDLLIQAVKFVEELRG